VAIELAVCKVARAGGLVMVVSTVLTGCPVNLHRSNTEQSVEKTRASIVVGRSDRLEVRRAAGRPVVSSDYWGFDLFRVSDMDLEGLLVLYVPVPVWAHKVNGYVLVTYDTDGIVASYGSGVAHQAEFTETVTAGGIELYASSTSGNFLLVADTPRASDFLQGDTGSKNCRLIVDWVDVRYGVRLHVDGQRLVSLAGPLNTAVTPKTVVPLKPGANRIVFSPTQWDASFDETRDVRCLNGGTIYASFAFEPGWPAVEGMKRRIRTRLTLSTDKPEGFQYRGLLIYAEGRWLVPLDPVNAP